MVVKPLGKRVLYYFNFSSDYMNKTLFIVGLLILILSLSILVYNKIISVLFVDDNYIDGYVRLHNGNESEYIYIGHYDVIKLCGGKINETTTISINSKDYNVTCSEVFMGCGAINCECWVV